jgi:hypothetical protein
MQTNKIVPGEMSHDQNRGTQNGVSFKLGPTLKINIPDQQ